MQLYLLGFTAAAELKNATGINVWMILAGRGKKSERRSNQFMFERVDRYNKCIFGAPFLERKSGSFRIFLTHNSCENNISVAATVIKYTVVLNNCKRIYM